MSLRWLGRSLGGLALIVGWPAPVGAGSFQVTPVTSTLTSGHAIEAFTIRNTGDSPGVVQVELERWSQDGGKDRLEPTEELLATPPLFRIGAGEAQVVRVGLRHRHDESSEIDYRVIFAEVPPPPAPGFRGLAVALHLSVPLFVQPKQVSQSMSWHLVRGSDGSMRLEVMNTGNAHVKIGDWSLSALDDVSPLAGSQTPRYVLAGQSVSWPLPPSKLLHQGDSATLSAHTEAGFVQLKLAVAGD
jgi:fimbrial chaperone protein